VNESECERIGHPPKPQSFAKLENTCHCGKRSYFSSIPTLLMKTDELVLEDIGHAAKTED
jgi:hypothetical protein